MSSWKAGVLTTAVRQILDLFEALRDAEKHEVTVELLRRAEAEGPIPGEALIEAAEELFLELDAEEAQRGIRCGGNSR